MRWKMTWAPAARSASGVLWCGPPSLKPNTVAPAATPAVAPVTVSSITAQRVGSTPSAAAAARRGHRRHRGCRPCPAAAAPCAGRHRRHRRSGRR
ncbi:hypothetical protein G6F61_014829 [Rhizopus arrhizus]|nr:hypothetical protein G6F61_014829 [Rhizopus arrhizus]